LLLLLLLIRNKKMVKNRRVLFASRPKGMPVPTDFQLNEQEFDLPKAKAELNEGEVVVQTLYLSTDPTMRGRMNDVAPGYTTAYALNEPINGIGLAKVLGSRNPGFSEGDLLSTFGLPWVEYAVLPAKALGFARKIAASPIPLPSQLSFLGMTGLTAYFGLLHVGTPKAGETVVVSGAAGATGMMVGQIAKIKGCKVIGIAGGADKCAFLKEVGYDHVIDYKATSNMKEEIQKATEGKGVDVYFDNVGGDISTAVHQNLNKFARIALCGQIAHYNAENPPVGPKIEGLLIVKSIKMQGFLMSDFAAHFGEAFKDLIQWYQEGKIKDKYTIKEGIENAASAFIGMLKGENVGKMLIKVSD